MQQRPPAQPKTSPDAQFPVVRVAGRYKVGKLLGSGSFGRVYFGRDVETGMEVALKVERREGSDFNLRHEYEVYKELVGCVGISNAYWYGTEGPYNVMVMDRHEISLDVMVKRGDLSFHTYASQMLRSLEYLHAYDYIHRDIKPENFMVGVDNTVYLIDLGLAQLYRDPRSRVHIPETTGNDLVGTFRYASVNTHMGINQARRDDVESLGYTLIYLYYGKLPWQGIKSSQSADHTSRVVRWKQRLSRQSSKIHSQLAFFLNYTQSLCFGENPDYIHLRALLRRLAK